MGFDDLGALWRSQYDMTPEEFAAIAKDRPVDIGIISTKSYDTEWAAELVLPALADNGCFGQLAALGDIAEAEAS